MRRKPSTSELLREPRNVELLRVLGGDPRISVSELARRIGLSAPAARERLLRLEEDGVIEGYRLAINPAALGYPICAYVRVRPAPGQLGKIAELANALPQVVECHRVTGEDCFIVKVFLPALEDLDRVLDRFLAFGQTATSLVQSTPTPLRGLPLPGEEASGRKARVKAKPFGRDRPVAAPRPLASTRRSR